MNSADIIIRRADLSDIPTLLAFEQGVVSAERPFDPTLKTPHAKYYDLEQLITSAETNLLVAEEHGKLIASGYARIERSKSFLQHTHHGYLGFMYTLSEHRGRGINKLIMEALEDWAKEQGLTELRLEVYYGNEAAVHAYEKIGFSRLMIEMRKGI